MANQGIPILERQETIHPAAKPDVQGAFQELAESSNNLGAIGAKVAQSASNEMAVTLGYEEGNTPHGDLLPPITEFDKNFSDTYHQQAAATLSVQGEKLLSDAHIEMSKAPRLTPELISKTNQQLQTGLSKIADNAPTAVKGSLKQQFDSQILNQTTQYNTKMISQQREDEKNTLVNAIAIASRNARDAGSNGDLKGAEEATKSVANMADNGKANNHFTPEEARVYKETAEQNKFNGIYTHLAMQAQASGKLDQFEKNFADKKLPGMDKMNNEQWITSAQSVYQQMNFLQALRSQQENLDATKFQVKVALNPNTISGSDLEQLRTQVTPNKFEELHLGYIKAIRTFNKDQGDAQDLMSNWSDPRAHAASTAKVIDKTFENQVDAYKQKGVAQQDAEVLVAAHAGGVVPELTRSIKNRLASPNPAMIESATQQIHALDQIGAGNALNGLNQQDMAMYHAFASVRDANDPNKAAQDAHDRIYNQDPDITTANEQKWNNQLHDKKPTGLSLPDYGLLVAGISQEKYLNAGDKTVYGNDLVDEYKSNYIASGGDDETAKKMLQQSVKNNYGYTNVNGIKQFTKHPIENVLNLPDNSIGVIQEDIYNQLGKHFENNKKAYDAGQVNEYWELTPRQSPAEIAKKGTDISLPKNYFKNDRDIALVKDVDKTNYAKPIEVIRHIRGGGIGKKYTIMIKSNPFASKTDDVNHPTHAGWDIAVNSDDGVRNLSREAPYLGVITYDPDIKFIKSEYTKLHPLK